jgi:hypothetical protein
MQSKFPADAGFICDTVPMTAAMLRTTVKDTPFIMKNLRFSEWCCYIIRLFEYDVM